jgi:hypothetical protein
LVAQLEQINPTDAKPNSSAGPVGTAQLEANRGYENFSAVKKAMTTPSYEMGLTNVSFHDTGAVKVPHSGTPDVRGAAAPEAPVQSAAALAAKTPAIDGQQTPGEQPGVIKPKDDSEYKTPVLKSLPEPDDRPVDENGRRSFDSTGAPNPDLPYDYVQTSVGTDGKPKSIVSMETNDDGDVKTTFDFDDKGNVKSRTIDRPDGKDVVQFDADGKPTSRMVTKPGASVPEPADVNPNDKVTVQRDASGKPTSMVSEDGDTTTKLTLDDNGKVTSRSIGTDSQDIDTKFDSNGRAVYDQTTSYDQDGKKTKTSTITPDATTDETFDKDGKVVKTEEWSGQGDYHTTNETLNDGTTVSRAESDGVDRMVINRPDGTRMEYTHDENLMATSTKITNPDGTVSGTVDTHDNTTAYKTDADGFWDAITVAKRGGVATHYSGGPGQDPAEHYLSGTTSTPI